MIRSIVRLGLMPQVKNIQTNLFINNKFVPAVSSKTFETLNPATEEVIARVAEAGDEDLELAVKAAREAFNTYRTTEGSTRRQLLLTLADLLHAEREEMAALECMDNGKPFQDALGDVGLFVECLRYYAGFADKLYGSLSPVSGNNIAILRRQPIGVCGLIVPWNFPLVMVAWKLPPALAAGNTVILKPAEQTPLTTLRLGELCIKAGFPPGVVNILTGFGPTTGAGIVLHKDIDKIAFTGSWEVGKEIVRMSSVNNLKKVSLELGGKSPLIVCEDADMDKAISLASIGTFMNSGQVCTASSRIYVHESIYDTFVKRLKLAAEQCRVGPGSDPDVTMGPLISQTQLERVLGYIEKGKAEGATLLTGGTRIGNKGYFVKPTIFTNVKDDMVICKEEIFGPVTCVMKFKDMEEVIQRANASSYGLAAGLCTENVDTALRYSTFLDAGSVWVNTWNSYDAAQPFGGFKQSGYGRDGGAEALEEYTQVKSVKISLNGPIVRN
ncbi:unnamed protein product [Phytomonas sp. EM1]|nr:unnamed protein product [Phytomonas sp. EM1]|eukprot:CCW63390.1 unnamed protein product [Phytomonas sp. isolate EM1]